VRVLAETQVYHIALLLLPRYQLEVTCLRQDTK